MKNILTIIASLVLAITAVAQDVKPLNVDERAATGYTHKITITAADVAAAAAGSAATNVTLRIFPPTSGTVQSNSIIGGAAVILTTPFSNASGAQQTQLGLQVGDAGDLDRYVSAASVGPSNIVWSAASTTVFAQTTGTNYLTAGFYGTNANASVALTNLSTGELKVLLRIVPLESLDD